jgi:zinc transport system ATP-binding protein
MPKLKSSQHHNEKNLALCLHEVSVSFPQIGRVVDSVTLELETGTLNVIIGPNGSGKTTLLKAVLGLYPYTGTIRTFGNSIEKKRSLIGYIPQRFQFDLTFPITTTEFLSLTFAGHLISSAQVKSAIMTQLQELHAEDLADQRLSSLSGGQLQRVLLCRALLHSPKLLLLDEPETGIDLGGGLTFYELLRDRVKKTGLTVLMTSHELEIVSQFADQVIFLNHRLICQGKPHKVMTTKNLQAVFGTHIGVYGHH